jgi:long-chain acyl-CoA synthetase
MTIAELVEQQAKALGDKTYLLFEEDEYSYRHMYEVSARVAANLAKRGVGNEEKIVVLMGNCVEFLYLFFGAGRIGAVIVPVNPTLKPDEIAYIANNADATTLVTIPELAPLLPMVKSALPKIKHVFVLGAQACDGAEPFSTLLEPVEEVPPIVATEDSDAALIYTSGTTGMPKGVVLTHKNYVWNARMMRDSNNILATDRFMCILPVFHVNAQVVTLLTPWMAGGDVFLMGRFNVMAILPMIEKYKINIMSAVPTIYSVLCSLPRAGEYDLSSMRFFVSGAAPMPEETYKATQRVLKRPLIMGYGLSEATCASAVASFSHPIKWNSVGPALRYTGIRIVDKNGRDVPPGEVGEILVSGPAVMKCYYKNPEATAEALKDGWLRTGDLGRLDEYGYLYIVGRLKDMIIRGGQNIYPAQIESVLSKMPGVEEVCVVGVEEARWGQEVLAVIKPAAGAALAEKDALEFCKEHLAPYKCPQYVRFVEDIPKTATGKIKKNVVAEQFADIAMKKK